MLLAIDLARVLIRHFGKASEVQDRLFRFADTFTK